MATIIKRFNFETVITHHGKHYTADLDASRMLFTIPTDVPKGCIIVTVLAKNLHGKTDLHGNPYPPSIYLYRHTPSAITNQ